MKKTIASIKVAMPVLLALQCAVFAQTGMDLQQQAQKKLLAQRAARADAIRKLAERIKGLNITSETTVNDFVAENDQIETHLQAWLMGMKEECKYKHFDDGTCEVTMSVTMRSVIRELTTLYKSYYKGDKIKLQDIEQMRETVKLDKIVETGKGVVPEELDDMNGQAGVGVNEPYTRKANVPPIWAEHCTGRGRLMAERAGRMDALRRLAERIKGLKINSETTVNDFVAENDQIETTLNTSIRGAKEVRVKFLRNELICEVTMQIQLKTILGKLRTAVQANYKGDNAKIKMLDEYVENVRIDTIEETGSACPPEQYMKGYSPQQIQAVQRISGSNVPGWVNETLTAKGQAALDTGEYPNEAQAKLMAVRAAELVARRKLAEQLEGLKVDSGTTVKDFLGKNDTIRTKMVAYQLGAHVVDGSEKVKDGVAEIEVEMPLMPVWKTISYSMVQVAN